MVAVSRWNEYDVDAETNYEGVSRGERAYSIASTAGLYDTVTLDSTHNAIHVTQGAEDYDIILASGTNLDPRFVALDIQRKVQAKALVASSGTAHKWEFATCKWENGKFKLRSGDFGTSSSVAVGVPDNGHSALSALQWDTVSEGAGTDLACSYLTGGGVVTISGTYVGLYDDVYTVICTGRDNIDPGNVSVTAGSFDGTVTVSGDWNNPSAADTYTVTISTANGSIMGGGTGAVPRIISVTSTPGSINDSTVTELLYPDYWYPLGPTIGTTGGVRIKFSDGSFTGNGSDQVIISIGCTRTQYATAGVDSSGTVGTNALVIVRSERGDDWYDGVERTPTLSKTTHVALGTKGLTMAMSNNVALTAGNEFKIIARAVRPTSGDAGITQVNYGNVTVSTESPIKVVQFEIMSGAVLLNDCKFGLYSHGSFAHHNAGDSDTYMHFGTVGAGNPSEDGNEWASGVTATDLGTDKAAGVTGTPTHLYHVKNNLSVVNSADNSQPVGNEGLIADPAWIGIKVGASETGATTVTYRMFFDYS